jgi:hypothetical protein
MSAPNCDKIIANPTIPYGMNHSTSELRFLELEAGFVSSKKYEELSKTVENLSKQLNERVTKLVRNPSASKMIKLIFKYKLVKTKKRNCMKETYQSKIS